MKRSISQKIARLMQILGWILLIPMTLFSLGMALYLLAISFSAGLLALFAAVAILATYAFGTFLLYGYHKHTNGEITRLQAIWLWIGTILFNGAPLTMMFLSWAKRELDDNGFEPGNLIFYNLFGAYQAIVLLAVVALYFDLKRDFD